MRIDLHTHSTASDGTEPPAEVVASAARAGLDVVALTDHDTTAGWAAAEQAAHEHGVALVRGTEVSARARGVSVHLLAYLQDPTHPALVAELERTRAARDGRARAMVDLIAADHPLTWEDVLEHTSPGTVVGRPHIADALVRLGVVASRDAAFVELLRSDGPYHVPHYAPSAVAAVRAVRAAGGVPVFAHPGADGRGRVVSDDVFDELADAGLAGLEVHHRDHTPAQRERLTRIAERLGLLMTGSSDYHGAGKANLLGENLTQPSVLADIEKEGTVPVVRP
ncbi:PHP domain-containing protein [Cellulomonas cellasea]|uniref:Metal-dependent phosphoesterase n=2 Tax=Cellulomonas cellasea TaxID=43670 RepID=A0A0A0B3D3_9CELL|nr:PHP domain-containing protein [Cellulomonas cellasea]KGM00697.1 metal-dependent phosphoesterase [Cellulomonas cellasea DSM 20118]GEA86146.1 metal-dependent phosphoesterase [Cellulomonas cellasea]